MMTDDASTVSEMRKLRPMWHIVTLADPEARGHDTNKFEEEATPEQRFNSAASVIVDIEIATRCDFFIGANESNVVQLVRALRNQPLDTCVEVEGNKWTIANI